MPRSQASSGENDPNSADRSTVARPLETSSPRSFVPSGISVLMNGCAACSLADGPASNAVIAASAVAGLVGIVRRTGTRAASSPNGLCRRKYARALAGTGVGEGDGRGVAVAGASVGDGLGGREGDGGGDAVG